MIGDYSRPGRRKWFGHKRYGPDPTTLVLLLVVAGVCSMIWLKVAFQPPHSANRHDAGCRGAGAWRSTPRENNPIAIPAVMWDLPNSVAANRGSRR